MNPPLRPWPWRWWQHLPPTPSAKSLNMCVTGDPVQLCNSTPVQLMLPDKTTDEGRRSEKVTKIQINKERQQFYVGLCGKFSIFQFWMGSYIFHITKDLLKCISTVLTTAINYYFNNILMNVNKILVSLWCLTK